MSQHKAPQGFLTFAKNSDQVDYLDLAYIQALNIKATQSECNQFAVIVDQETHAKLKPHHEQAFDFVIVHDSDGPYDAEAMAFWLTPFKETIKLESDLLFTRSIDHWWHAFRYRDVCLSQGCRDYQQQISHCRKYRELFDANNLPDVYNGLMYFRFSQTARDFFTNAKRIFENWSQVQSELKNMQTAMPSTDVVFALAARITGVELCTLPSMDFINFVHMKPAINNFSEEQVFTDVFVTEFDSGMIRINNVNQYHPVHYYDKDFITEEMREYYERFRRIN